TGKSGATHTSHFFNTGTFLKRNGQWRVIAWQATRIPQPEEDKAAILNLQQQWEIGFGNHDAAALASLYTDDCVRMPNGGVTSIGRQALEAAYRKDFAELWKTKSTISIKTDEVVVSGDYAFARGTDTTSQEKNGTTSSETGKWMATYRRQPDG